MRYDTDMSRGVGRCRDNWGEEWKRGMIDSLMVKRADANENNEI